jgi:hypothetical protein
VTTSTIERAPRARTALTEGVSCAVGLHALTQSEAKRTLANKPRNRSLSVHDASTLEDGRSTMAARTKAKVAGESSMAGVRLSAEVLVRIATHGDRMRQANPWATITQSDALRDLVLKGLEVSEGHASARRAEVGSKLPSGEEG